MTLYARDCLYYFPGGDKDICILAIKLNIPFPLRSLHTSITFGGQGEFLQESVLYSKGEIKEKFLESICKSVSRFSGKQKVMELTPQLVSGKSLV